jgi:predicted NAD/FAD-binding protein
LAIPGDQLEVLESTAGFKAYSPLSVINRLGVMVISPNASIAVIGSGAAGLSAAWLLSKHHDVTLFEKDDRLGGHAHTAEIESDHEQATVPVDTGFIVYNEPSYPNLTCWFDALGVHTKPADMSFAVSQNYGGFEYKGGDIGGLFAQPSNVFKPRFWSMLSSLVAFYKRASSSPLPPPDLSLGEYLKQGGYSAHFINDHLLPFGAAIWSTTQRNMLDYPAATFIRFCDNHGLLKLSGRPQWRTVDGGSKAYVQRVRQQLGDGAIRTNAKIVRVRRATNRVYLEDRDGTIHQFSHVVLATHADQALEILDDADAREHELLSPFRYEQNLAILHTDESLLPRRRKAWASWNYINGHQEHELGKPCVSYWMNSLQSIDSEVNYIVSLNPQPAPAEDRILRSSVYAHPIFDADTLISQQKLWRLQGRRNTWFCGSYFGAGFHEDAVQSGLAVAEALGGDKRPWQVADESGRIILTDLRYPVEEAMVA